MTADLVDNWDAHWRAYGEAVQDNPAQSFRQRVALQELALPPLGGRLVDFGSGQGDLLVMAHHNRPGMQLLGLEKSAAGIGQAQRKLPNARFVRLDLLESSACGEFEAWGTHGTCCEVIEHVDDPVRLLRHAATFLSPASRLLVTAPGGPRSAYDRHIGHRRHFDAESLCDVLVRAGFTDIRIRRAGFPFFNLYRLLVIARGRRLIADVDTSVNDGRLSTTARFVMRAFDRLLRWSVRDSRWGWQLVAVAVPGPSASVGS